ncbi:Wzz/FepE/Etk N-terminal domain-containing protein [Kocuria sp. JC486]|uniref:YveK family protein n=1 Tax=Kocuria sp. JC486 TaxID=1970736 RepID=UPI0032AEB38B
MGPGHRKKCPLEVSKRRQIAEQGGEMDFVDYVMAFRRSVVWVLISTIIGALIGGAVALMTPPRYLATATTLLTATEATEAAELPQIGTYMSQQIATLSTLATTETVLQPVIDDLGMDTTPQELATRVSVSTPPDTMMVEITTTGADPDEAAETSNAIAQQLSETVDEVAPTVAEEGPVTSMETVTQAPVPTRDQSVSLTTAALAGAALGFLLGLVIAVAQYAFAQRRHVTRAS